MAWSTSELARLAGTTVNTIRHYHRSGLLEEPERRHNGYKQYGTPDLVRLLRIRRLVELGVPLTRIKALTADGDGSPAALRQVDTEHAAAIERLAKAREDIATILREQAPADSPPGFESVAARLSEADRSIVHVYTQVYDEKALADLQRLLTEDHSAADDDFDSLPADADEATRQNLAEKFAPQIAKTLRDYPWMNNDPMAHVLEGKSVTRETFDDAMRELHNEAQFDVLVRAKKLARELLGAQDE
ncbi:MerR family transcriptional regulator [Paractinoplanes hotanensis]|uniref:MerR family transcriptional regulator n=1 Tax=Paractinoplanes hotanensis TaxID=2906497 RepID=A0ABT0XW04_9ACTN|nr:MerR family transcriptional regulator [Actinoplanes hotanensis]MCM4077907.1 MerR family transcriptional regulator [Actinoplanes hotanensis]